MVLGWFPGWFFFPFPLLTKASKSLCGFHGAGAFTCCGSQLKPRVKGGRVDLHVPWRTWCSVGSILAVLCGECALIRR